MLGVLKQHEDDETTEKAHIEFVERIKTSFWHFYRIIIIIKCPSLASTLEMCPRKTQQLEDERTKGSICAGWPGES